MLRTARAFQRLGSGPAAAASVTGPPGERGPFTLTVAREADSRQQGGAPAGALPCVPRAAALGRQQVSGEDVAGVRERVGLEAELVVERLGRLRQERAENADPAAADGELAHGHARGHGPGGAS